MSTSMGQEEGAAAGGSPPTIGFAESVDKLRQVQSEDVQSASSGFEEKANARFPRRSFTVRSTTSGDEHPTHKDGIYNMRDVTRTFSHSQSKVRAATWNWRTAGREPEDDDPGLQRSTDFRHKEVYRGRLLFWLAYQSVGAIYGDIGTSPLYVYSSTFRSAPSRRDLVGVLSIIIWSLTMMVTIKYVLIILHADNESEGGTFSTYSLLSRYINITNRDPREASLIQMKRYNTGDLEGTGGRLRRGIEHSSVARALLKIIGVLAVSMVMSDGILTPAQSVLGAVQGLNVVAPNITNSVVVGVTAAILILLFVIQPLGTSRLASVFAPVIIIFLSFNAGFGIYNLSRHDWRVLEAFNPGFAFEYLIRNKTDGWKSLGGVLLAFTGVEALFADLGAFSMRAIQISWLGFTFPCLLLAYIGQAAYIAENPEAYSNPFFNSVPHGWLIPSLIFAVLAAIVASQAIITATFQLLAQIMKLSYFPQIKVVHTSKIFHGQLYVPLANWLLMIGTVLVAAIYKNTTALGNAYGVCVMFVTFFDTCMVSLAAMFVWRISPYFVVFPFLTIACLDGTFLSSALVKVPDGAWFTITLAGVLAALFILWRFGKEQQWSAEAADRYPTTHFVKRQDDGTIKLAAQYGGQTVTSVKGFGIFFDKDGTTIPPVFSQFMIKLVAAPEIMVLFHLRPLEKPSVPIEERYNVSRLAIPNCYRLVVRHGYSDVVINPDLAALIKDQIINFITHDGVDQPTRIRGNTITSDPHDHEFALSNSKYSNNLPIIGRSQSQQATMADNKIPTAENPTSSALEKTTSQDRVVFRVNTSSQNTQLATSDANASASNNLPEKTTSNNMNQPLSNANNNSGGDAKAAALAKVEAAYAHQVLYIVGKSQLKVSPDGGYVRRALLWAFLWLRDNTRTKIASLKVPNDRLFEVGFVKDI